MKCDICKKEVNYLDRTWGEARCASCVKKVSLSLNPERVTEFLMGLEAIVSKTELAQKCLEYLAVDDKTIFTDKEFKRLCKIAIATMYAQFREDERNGIGNVDYAWAGICLESFKNELKSFGQKIGRKYDKMS